MQIIDTSSVTISYKMWQLKSRNHVMKQIISTLSSFVTFASLDPELELLGIKMEKYTKNILLTTFLSIEIGGRDAENHSLSSKER